MDETKYAIHLTDAQEVKLIACDPEKEIFDIGRSAIGCDWIELVQPELLAREGLLLMIDEEAKLKGVNFINCIASFLYESDRHGDPIVGDAVLVKSSGESLELLSAAEARRLVSALDQIRGSAIGKIADAFGLRPSRVRDAESIHHVNRQPCRKDSQER